MAVSKEVLFNKIETNDPWSAAAVFKRSLPIPIEKFSVFKSKELAEDYALNNPVAYPGQLIAVIPDQGVVVSYIIQLDGSLLEIGSGGGSAFLKEYIQEITNKGSEITYTKGNNDQVSFNTTFVGTKEEYTNANAAGQIAIGTIVYITDDVSTDNSSVINEGKINYMIIAYNK